LPMDKFGNKLSIISGIGTGSTQGCLSGMMVEYTG